jgi:hypothetical protein
MILHRADHSRIDVIESGQLVLDQDFAGTRLGDGQVGLELEHLGTSDLFDQDSSHGSRDVIRRHATKKMLLRLEGKADRRVPAGKRRCESGLS